MAYLDIRTCSLRIASCNPARDVQTPLLLRTQYSHQEEHTSNMVHEDALFLVFWQPGQVSIAPSSPRRQAYLSVSKQPEPT
jgi:hypothetical protein